MKTVNYATLGVAALGILAGSAFAAFAQSDTGTDSGSRPRDNRPLTVRRHAAPPVVVAVKSPRSPFDGPGGLVMAPVHAAGAVAALPFRVLGGIFPATGNVATTPFVLVGAPIRAAGEIAQFPFQVVDAAFAASNPIFRTQ